MLGFKMKDTIIKNSVDVYRKYGMELHSIKDLRFEE